MELHLIELHSMKLNSINCFFIIFSFSVPIKINKDTANTYTCSEKYNKSHYVYCAGTAFRRTIYLL